MASYEVEHDIPSAPPPNPSDRPRRPDMSTFMSALEYVDTSGEQRTHHNNHAIPTPGDISAVFRSLAEALETMLDGNENNVVQTMLDSLSAQAERPPAEVKGVPQGFLDGK
ncbi:MAG: hypothetical protein M1812_003906 [Candelaria pacifica]|nr:MAG: hypothetical protein M1812_003906 [Candelaria pacifica]